MWTVCTESVQDIGICPGAKRALVGSFREGCCTLELAGLEDKIREGIFKGIGKRTTPEKVYVL